jgi:hypothetical protein
LRLSRRSAGASSNWTEPAGRELGPAFPLGKKALETDSVEPVVKLLTHAVQKGLREQFKNTMSRQTFGRDIVARQRYIGTCVDFIDCVDRAYEATGGATQRHDAEKGPAHKD